MYKDIARYGLLCGLVILMMAGCNTSNRQGSPSNEVSSAPAAESVKVRLKWLHQAQFAGFYTAKEKGLYKSLGLDVQLNPGGVDFPAVQMIVGGSEQFGVTGADQILLARSEGVPIVAVATIYRDTPVVLFSLAKSGITRPEQFVGKRIGVKLGGNEELTYRALMKRAGVDTSRIKEIPVKYDMSPLYNGDIAVWPGYIINEPLIAQEKGHQINLIKPSDYGVHLYADTLFTTEEMIRTRPDLVRRFVDATISGWEYSISHVEEAIDYTMKYGGNGLERGHEKRMLEASIPLLTPDSTPIGAMSADRWQELRLLLKEQDLLKTDIDVQKAFTNEFLKSYRK